MPQQPVELILMRQLASALAMPIFLVDGEGDLLFYNEPAEVLLGRRFDDTGEMPLDELSPIFRCLDEDGNVIPSDALPIGIAVNERRPAHRSFMIEALDGVARRLSTTAFPLRGQSGRYLGAVAIFWEDCAG